MSEEKDPSVLSDDKAVKPKDKNPSVLSEDKSARARNKKDMVKKLEAKIEENLNGWKRAQADLINYKKQVATEKQELIKYSNVALLMEILPVYNNLKLAARHIPKAELGQDWVKGILQINKQFKDFLANLGIQEIKTVGEEFNPELHEAVLMEENDEYQSGAIFEEIAPGYKIYERILIAAKVKVAK